MTANLIDSPRSVSVAINFNSLTRLDEVVSVTHDIEGIDSYIIGGSIGLRGLAQAARIVHQYDYTAHRKKIVYDHQKAGTSDVRSAKPMLETVAQSGIDAVVLFPIQNLQAQGRWIESAQHEGLGVVVGPEIADMPSMGGDSRTGLSFVRMFIRQAARNGVSNIWVRDPRRVQAYEEILEEERVQNHTLFLAKIANSTTGKIERRPPVNGRAVAVIGAAICDVTNIEHIRERAQSLASDFLKVA